MLWIAGVGSDLFTLVDADVFGQECFGSRIVLFVIQFFVDCSGFY